MFSEKRAVTNDSIDFKVRKPLPIVNFDDQLPGAGNLEAGYYFTFHGQHFNKEW
jgi:hypothetical protein